MTDRINAFVVVLDVSLRDDEAKATLNALAQVKGVLWVDPHVEELSDIVATARARRELGEKLWRVLYSKEPPHAR